jgi:ubiquitin-protein ligase
MQSFLDLVKQTYTVSLYIISILILFVKLADTPFEDGTFKLVLQFDETYVRFLLLDSERLGN